MRLFEERNLAQLLVTLGDNDYTRNPARFAAAWRASSGWLPAAGVEVAGTLGNFFVLDSGAYAGNVTVRRHDHNYQRFAPVRGVVHVVHGGGGARLCRWRRCPGLAAALTLSSVDLQGRVIDRVTIRAAGAVQAA